MGNRKQNRTYEINSEAAGKQGIKPLPSSLGDASTRLRNQKLPDCSSGASS